MWLELDRLHGEDTSSLEEAKAGIHAWGVHRCNSWDDFNGYVQCLGENAMEAAYYDEGGMTMC